MGKIEDEEELILLFYFIFSHGIAFSFILR